MREYSNQRLIQKWARVDGPTISSRQTMPKKYNSSIKRRHKKLKSHFTEPCFPHRNANLIVKEKMNGIFAINKFILCQH